MKVVEQNKVSKAGLVLQAVGIFGEYLNRAVDTLSPCWLYWCPFGFFERGMNDSDWLVLHLIHNFWLRLNLSPCIPLSF